MSVLEMLYWFVDSVFRLPVLFASPLNYSGPCPLANMAMQIAFRGVKGESQSPEACAQVQPLQALGSCSLKSEAVQDAGFLSLIPAR